MRAPTKEHPIAVFEPPYETLRPCHPDVFARWTDVDLWKGRAIVWLITPHGNDISQFESLRCKPPGLPIIVLLPPPSEVHQVLDMLALARYLTPRMVLPYGLIDTPYRLRQVMAAPPRSVPMALTDYLVRRGLLRNRKAIREFRRIVELAPEIRSVSALSRRMYTSRRTIGRHFLASGMPVPSHCLHFARILYVALQLQVDGSAVFRIASRYRYPDGFTLSNQMKRLVGYRPSEVRRLLGWEWIVEAWLKQEHKVVAGQRGTLPC